MYVLAGLALLALGLFAESVLRSASFSPGKEVSAEGLEDVLVSAENNPYPPSDVGRFTNPPERVYVYLVVDGRTQDFKARVRREGSESLISRVFPRGPEVVAVDGRPERLSATGSGVSGVTRFTVKTASGEQLPAGNYTVEVYPAGGDAVGEPAAVKSFIVRSGS